MRRPLRCSRTLTITNTRDHMAQLFLDLDGVLADFDKGARDLLGMPPRAYQEHYGVSAFWKMLATSVNFYGSLEPMPDAQQLMEAVRHLDPIILTGVPIGKWAEPQKRVWLKRNFPGIEIITTMARLKSTYCEQGDVLVDDQERSAEAWNKAGGLFIHHTSAEQSIAELRHHGII